MPEQPPPDQPVKVEPAAGVAVSVTGVGAAGSPVGANRAEHVRPHSMPVGLLVTVPDPVPAFDAVISASPVASSSASMPVVVVPSLAGTSCACSSEVCSL